MKRMHVLFCVCLVIASQTAQAGLIKHVSGGGTATANGTAFRAAVTKVLADYPTTDTVMLDDTAIYDIGISGLAITKGIRIVAASGTTPTVKFSPTSLTNTTWFITTSMPGTQFGSSAAGEDGRITFDGSGNCTRGIGLSTAALWPTTATATTTIENVVITGMNDGRNTRGYFWPLSIGGWSTATPMNGSNVINIRNVEFQFPTTTPALAGQKRFAITVAPENGSTYNIENVRSNGCLGYLIEVGSGMSQYAAANGTVNIKNCSLYQDQFSTHPLMQAPIQIGGWDPRNGGYDVNIDNCFIRTDARRSSQIATWTNRASDTSNSLGCITVTAHNKNNLTITNSALVGCGAVLSIETTSSQIRVTNSDLYVNSTSSVSDGTVEGFVTPGYFLNISKRVAAVGNHQTTMTRCNLYGLAGSNLENGLKQSSDRYVMVECNDWSPTNAYAAGWIRTNCVEPGNNPGYGAMAGETSDPGPGLAAKDFTVYNQALRTAGIGSNRSFAGMGVPVELSAFDVR